MHRIRKAAVASTTMSTLTIATGLSCHVTGWPAQTDLFQSIAIALIGMAAGTCSVALWCTYITIRLLRTSTEELADHMNQEVKALHRSMVVAMEEYGNARAIDAVVANERRHINEQNTGAETADLTRAAAKVTPLRRRHEPR
jgi:hypothetical protein